MFWMFFSHLRVILGDVDVHLFMSAISASARVRLSKSSWSWSFVISNYRSSWGTWTLVPRHRTHCTKNSTSTSDLDLWKFWYFLSCGLWWLKIWIFTSFDFFQFVFKLFFSCQLAQKDCETQNEEFESLTEHSCAIFLKNIYEIGRNIGKNLTVCTAAS